ncbi:hypothetical protein BH09MYX1_BH09MYX1_57550 [soil metagenome]
MRTTARCPKCNCQKLYVCENRQPDDDSSNVVHGFRVTTVEISREDLGAQSGSSYRTHVGTYETWICSGCGYTEWYAQDPEHLLEKLSKMRGSGVRVVERTTEAPYR